MSGTPDTVFHIADRQQWSEAEAADEYRWSTLGVDLDEEGFIHTSLDHQVAGVAAQFYAGYPHPLVLLEIDVASCVAGGVECRMEDGGAGELFPHLYGALRPAWVRRVHPAGVDADGGFTWGDT